MAGVLYVLAELILQAFGKSICYTEGCKVVAQYVRFGDSSILIIGFLMFAALAALTALNLNSGRETFEKYINIILIAALASEGYFTGYQAFSIHVPCFFCLTLFGLLFVLGVLRLLSGEREIVAGFAAMAVVFSLLYLVLPAGGAVHLPADEQFVLFYSKECKYCAEVIGEIEESRIPVKHVLVNEYSDFLRSMGIEHVPTLYVNTPYEKLFITGKEPIESYLHCKSQGAAAERKKTVERQKKKAGNAQTGGTGTAPGIFSVPDTQIQVIQPPAGEGMCKENEECK